MFVAVQPVLYRRPSASAGVRTARRPPDLPGNVSRTVSLHGWARTGGGFWRTCVIHSGVDRHDLVVDLLHDLGIIETPREDSATWERAPCRMTAMTSFIAHTTVDCRNAYELSEWWKQVLGYVDLEGDPKEPGDEECLIVSPGSGHRLLFIEVPDEKRGKNRIHFDIQPYTGTRDEEVRRVVALGAEEVGDQRDHYRTGSGGSCSRIRRATSSASFAARRSGRRPRCSRTRERWRAAHYGAVPASPGFGWAADETP
jgi:hypothetical protein